MGFEQVVEQLAAGDPRLRLRALQELRASARSLSGEQRRRASQHVTALVDDEQPFVRWNAALTLGALGDESGLEALERLARQDDHANTRLRAALGLALLGDPHAVRTLESLAWDPYTLADQHPVRAFAALALGMLADPAALPALERLSGDEDPEVRWHATVSLGDVGDPAGVEVLSARASDPVPFVRAHT
ncbi:MAG: HEAT repeat domain-containing protein, partial [Haloechinothrix sp.]